MRPIAATLVFLCAAIGAGHAEDHWVGSWAASQQLVEPRNSLPQDDLHDATLRQVVHLSIGGAQLRVHVSNRYGTAPLHITSLHVAKPAAASDADRTKPLRERGGRNRIAHHYGSEQRYGDSRRRVVL